MKLIRPILGLSSVALCGLGAYIALAACSSDSGTTSGTSDLAKPPAKPNAPATTSTDLRTFAINKLLLGTGSAWKTLGYDVDGKRSLRGAKDVCTPREGAPVQIHEDGDRGIDNAFGQFILPLLATVPNIGDIEANINNTFSDGTFALLVQTKGLPTDGVDATSIRTFIFPTTSLGSKPTGTKSDEWPVRKDITVGGTVESGSTIAFPDAYTTKGTFVSGGTSTIDLNLAIGNASLKITIRNAVITFKPSGGKLTDGIISGVVGADELVAEIGKVAPYVSASACGGAFDSVFKQIGDRADTLLAGGTDGAKQCDALSIGLGFSAYEAANPTKVVDAPVNQGDPCAKPLDGGSD